MPYYVFKAELEFDGEITCMTLEKNIDRQIVTTDIIFPCRKSPRILFVKDIRVNIITNWNIVNLKTDEFSNNNKYQKFIAEMISNGWIKEN